tara:strand:+ start:667 stop:861 length:195 start_codon:yes stop_codon:yes gene_type:complete
MSTNIEIKLFVRTDKNGNEYLIGSPNLPAQINLDDYTFIVFYPEEDENKAKVVLRPKRREDART